MSTKSTNQTFHDIFGAARYMQAQDGETTTPLSSISRTLDVPVDEIIDVIETVGDTLVGLVGLGRDIALFFRVQ
jgi:hypothetical protein